jgi:hypothetical protein
VPSLQAWLLLHPFPCVRFGRRERLNNTGHQFLSLIGRCRRQDIGQHQNKVIYRLLSAKGAALEPAANFLDNIAMQTALAIKCHGAFPFPAMDDKHV